MPSSTPRQLVTVSRVHVAMAPHRAARDKTATLRAPTSVEERELHAWNYNSRKWEQLPLSEVVHRFRASVDVRDRKYRLSTYCRTFVGEHAVSALVVGGVARNREDAVRLGQELLDAGVIEHCVREHNFSDAMLFYRFIEDTDRGAVAKCGNRTLSWADFLDAYPASALGLPNITLYPSIDLSRLPNAVTHVARAFCPMDSHNVALLDNVHPPQWIDPKYSGTYALIVIGAGAAGLAAAAAAADLGSKVAVVEANVLGGGSLNVGGVPSKALLHAANLAHSVRNAKELSHCGITVEGKVKIDFGKVMERVRKVRARISENEAAVKYTRKLGVDVFYGHAKFTSEKSVVVSGNLLEFKRCIVATGSYPSIPPIPGLRELYGKQDAALDPDNMHKPRTIMTNDNFFNMISMPRRLCVLGTGVIGMELAQAMQRLGAQVTMFGRADGVLPNEDRDLVSEIVRQMEDDGVHFRLHVSKYDGLQLTGQYSQHGHAEVRMLTQERTGPNEYLFDAVLVATGRKPNVTGLNLEASGVDYDSKLGIKVNDVLQTSNSRIYAVGDCCSAYKMAHVAEATARVAVRNALLLRRERLSDLVVPFVAHTTPELAKTGPTLIELREEGRAFETFEYPFSSSDRARVEGNTTGVIRVHVEQGTGAILGAIVLGKGAAGIVAELNIAIKSDVRIEGLAQVIHPYPTIPEVVRQVALVGARKRVPSGARKFRSSRRQSLNKRSATSIL